LFKNTHLQVRILSAAMPFPHVPAALHAWLQDTQHVSMV